MKKRIRISPWLGALGLLGFLGFLPAVNGYRPYLFFMFFGFFGWFFWGKLLREKADERMVENQKRAQGIMLSYFALLSFAMIFLLDKRVAADMVLLIGALAYGLGFILTPALVLFFDQRAD